MRKKLLHAKIPSSHVITFTKDNAGYVLFDDIAYKFVPLGGCPKVFGTLDLFVIPLLET